VSEHKHTNRLIRETSPYLLQHAHNPVDWYPWGEEAFRRAREEDKPVFLSIGYSACHWCHVMERESFENEEIAALLNRLFISIKVDREERPDVDSVYMQAVQMMTGHGGWPMSMFLTPVGEPFFGGTYFPPDDRQGMTGFATVLERVSGAYHQRGDDVRQVAANIRAALQSRIEARHDGEAVTAEGLLKVARSVLGGFDREEGGFGGAPKFPPSMTLEFLAQTARAHDDAALREAVELTLKKMARGGMYDQIGGGFHRYSVDSRWLVPHFEKMLYDNALLARMYVRAWQWTKDPFYERIAKETLGYILREMTSPEGGFYSSLDADSEGEEGKFYVWTEPEVMRALGEEDGRRFCALYDITEYGNWEGHNIPNMPREPETVARELGISLDALTDVAARGKCRLYGVREERVRPARDEKILAGWNGWVLAALAEAALAFGNDAYRQAVRKNADFLITSMMPDGRMKRSFKEGEVKIDGLLEDYAGVAWGLLAAFEALQDRRWLEAARSLGDEILTRFSDSERGGFFDTPAGGEQLIARPKDIFDNATPSGNSLAAEVFFRLALYFGEEKYHRAATAAIDSSIGMAQRYPTGFGYLLAAAGHMALGAKEIAVTGSGPKRDELLKVIGDSFLPHRIIVASEQPDLPLMQERTAERAMAYVCRGYSCLEPTDDPEQLRRQLEE
jgi:uncharacterized protein